VLELRDAKSEIVGLVALHEPESRDQALDELVPTDARMLGLVPPARERFAHRAAKLVAIEPHEP